LPASFASAVTVTIDRKDNQPEKLMLARDAGDRMWEAAGRPIPEPDAMARVEYTAPGKDKPYWIELRVGGGAAKPSAGPNGGMVAKSAGGRIELVADREGVFKVWLLDATGGSRPVEGASARLKLAVPGYADVTLSVAGDHLEGRGAAIDADHATAVVIADVAGRTETARFSLHLEAGDKKHE
jgi:hypothetical protein